MIDTQQLNQLVQSMENTAKKLEKAAEEKKISEVAEAKKIILELQKKIAAEISALRESITKK